MCVSARHLDAVRWLAGVIVELQTLLKCSHETLENLLISFSVDDSPHIQGGLLEHSCLCVSVEIRSEYIDFLSATLHLHAAWIELLGSENLRFLVDVNLPISHGLFGVTFQLGNKLSCLRDTLPCLRLSDFSESFH